MSILCPTCRTPAREGARYCERDGTRLTPDTEETSQNGAAPAVPPVSAPLPVEKANCRCGAGPEERADGYCLACGKKWAAPRRPLPRDHVEAKLSPTFGGVSDRGKRHDRNEDDFALSLTADGTKVAIVCDGVSSSEEADRASAIAAKTMCDLLSQPFEDATNALGDAVSAANAAVCGLNCTAGATSEPPETTVVAAVVRERKATIAWAGDSRAYWIDGAFADASLLLTRDHSWLNEVVDSGEKTVEEAEADRLAHAITRCLGASDDPDSCRPSVVTVEFPDSDGYLLLCTDGLWNYVPVTERLAELVLTAPRNDGVVTVASALVAWANGRGGRDNITVALLAIPAADTQPDSEKEKQ